VTSSTGIVSAQLFGISDLRQSFQPCQVTGSGWVGLLIVVDLCFAGSRVTVKDLQPGTTYLLRITAKNEVGFGNYEQLRVKTKSLSKLLAYYLLLFVFI